MLGNVHIIHSTISHLINILFHHTFKALLKETTESKPSPMNYRAIAQELVGKEQCEEDSCFPAAHACARSVTALPWPSVNRKCISSPGLYGREWEI